MNVIVGSELLSINQVSLNDLPARVKVPLEKGEPVWKQCYYNFKKFTGKDYSEHRPFTIKLKAPDGYNTFVKTPFGDISPESLRERQEDLQVELAQLGEELLRTSQQQKNADFSRLASDKLRAGCSNHEVLLGQQIKEKKKQLQELSTKLEEIDAELKPTVERQTSGALFKQAMQALKQEEDTYQATMDQSSHGVGLYRKPAMVKKFTVGDVSERKILMENLGGVMYNVFLKYDKNGDGEIDESEFRNMMRDASLLRAEMDRDGDGILDAKEALNTTLENRYLLQLFKRYEVSTKAEIDSFTTLYGDPLEPEVKSVDHRELVTNLEDIQQDPYRDQHKPEYDQILKVQSKAEDYLDDYARYTVWMVVFSIFVSIFPVIFVALITTRFLDKNKNDGAVYSGAWHFIYWYWGPIGLYLAADSVIRVKQGLTPFWEVDVVITFLTATANAVWAALGYTLGTIEAVVYNRAWDVVGNVSVHIWFTQGRRNKFGCNIWFYVLTMVIQVVRKLTCMEKFGLGDDEEWLKWETEEMPKTHCCESCFPGFFGVKEKIKVEDFEGASFLDDKIVRSNTMKLDKSRASLFSLMDIEKISAEESGTAKTAISENTLTHRKPKETEGGDMDLDKPAKM